MSDMENNYTEEKMSDYAKQRAKHKEEIENLQAQLDAERQGRIEDKKLYFGKALESQGYQGDFSEFADKYAGSLTLDEMVNLYRGMNGAVQTTAPTQSQEEPKQQETIGPKSVIGTNPTITGTKGFEDMTIDELKAFGKSNLQMFS